MRIVVTGRDSLLRRATERSLAGEHELVLAAGTDLRDAARVGALVAGSDAIIHLAPLDGPGHVGDTDEALDLATRGTYVLLNAAATAGARRVVLGSALALLERYPEAWDVGEAWQPLPDVDDVGHLAAYLAEESAKQIARVRPLTVVCLRFGEVVDDHGVAGRPYDSRWLHVDDAVRAMVKALGAPLQAGAPGVEGETASGWAVYHIPGGHRRSRIPLAAAGAGSGLGYAPARRFEGGSASQAPATGASADLSVLAPKTVVPARPIRNVVIFGAGGPLAAATAKELATAYRLRLTDLRPLAEIVAEGTPQSAGAPLPEVLPPPHEERQVDVRSLDQVMAACEGMDAVVNCTVLRHDPVQAFLVNFLGAYHVMRAAVAHGIKRVVHTGPQLVTMGRPAGYWWDFRVPDDSPPRAGDWLYGHSKYLGMEVARLFAETHGLEVPVLLFSSFVNPATEERRPGGVFAMSVSWGDAALAMRRALEAPDLPSPFEPFHILADLPHGKYSNAKARRLLGWRPRDNLERLWAMRAVQR